MKKVIFSAFLALASVCSMNAQLYVGGSFGLTYSSLKIGDSDAKGGVSFKLLPEVGYQIQDKLAVGLSLGYMHGYASLGSLDVNDIKALVNTAASVAADLSSSSELADMSVNSFRFAPYARFTAAEFGKMEFFVDGVFGLNTISMKDKNYKKSNGDDDDSLSSYSKYSAEKRTVTCFEICAKPGLAYNINDNFKIFAKIGSVGFQHYGMKVKGSDEKTKINRFGLDFDGNNILLGVLYKF